MFGEVVFSMAPMRCDETLEAVYDIQADYNLNKNDFSFHRAHSGQRISVVW